MRSVRVLARFEEAGVDLQRCTFRLVDDEGQILCAKIRFGDRSVSPSLCESCPVAQIDCAHLRARMEQAGHPPVVVRFGNGKTEVWEDSAPHLSLESAACAAKTIPIRSPHDCSSCALRQHLSATASLEPPSRRARAARLPSPMPLAPRAPTCPQVIDLRNWPTRPSATGALNLPPRAYKEDSPSATAARAARSEPRGEEKRAGWTD